MNADRKDTGKHTTIRLDPWIRAEIEILAKSRRITFTDMVNHLLEYQLNQMGFSKAKYEAKIFNLERGENSENGATVDYSNSKIGNNSANVGSVVTQFTPVDNMGKMGDIYKELEKLPKNQHSNVLKKIIAILGGNSQDGTTLP
jgi:hypothetical protein